MSMQQNENQLLKLLVFMNRLCAAAFRFSFRPEGTSYPHYGLLATHSFDPHLEAIETLAGGDEQRMAIFAAETDVGGPRFDHVDVLNLFACGVKYGHAFAG